MKKTVFILAMILFFWQPAFAVNAFDGTWVDKVLSDIDRLVMIVKSNNIDYDKLAAWYDEFSVRREEFAAKVAASPVSQEFRALIEKGFAAIDQMREDFRSGFKAREWQSKIIAYGMPDKADGVKVKAAMYAKRASEDLGRAISNFKNAKIALEKAVNEKMLAEKAATAKTAENAAIAIDKATGK